MRNIVRKKRLQGEIIWKGKNQVVLAKLHAFYIGIRKRIVLTFSLPNLYAVTAIVIYLRTRVCCHVRMVGHNVVVYLSFKLLCFSFRLNKGTCHHFAPKRTHFSYRTMITFNCKYQQTPSHNQPLHVLSFHLIFHRLCWTMLWPRWWRWWPYEAMCALS